MPPVSLSLPLIIYPLRHSHLVVRDDDDDICFVYSSLTETGQGAIADGLLTDAIRRLKTFGVTLLPLDIRCVCKQDSLLHDRRSFSHLIMPFDLCVSPDKSLPYIP